MTAPGGSRRADPQTAPWAELAATLEGYPDPVAIVRPLRGRAGTVRDATIIAANAAYRALAGAPAGDERLAGARLGRSRPDHLAAVRDFLDGADGPPRTVRHERGQRLPNGGMAWSELTLVPAGAAVTVVERDVTAQHAAAEALAAAEEDARGNARRLAVLAEHATDALAMITPAGIVTWASAATTAMLGLREGDDLWTAWRTLVHADDAPAFEGVGARFRAGEPLTATTRLRTVAGGDRWFRIHLMPLAAGDDPFVSLVAAMQDVTAEEAAKADTARHRQELAEAQRIAHVGSWTLDLGTGARHWSDELYRIFGFDPAAPLPEPERAEAGIDPEVRAALVEARGRAIASGLGWSMEYELRRPDGTVCHVGSTGEAVRGDDGAVVALRGTIVDISERRRAREARIRRLEHQLDHVARVEHTMRTRIAVVNGWAEVLGDRDGSTRLADCGDALGAIARNGRELEGLLTGMLDAVRATSRAEGVELVPVEIGRIVAAIVHDYAALHDGVRLCSDLRPGLRLLGFDEGIDTVLRHLVENAIRHGGHGVSVTIASRTMPDGRVELAITDDGPGFPPGEDVFAAFGRRQGGPGHGLGMHVVRTLVEAMGGEVAAQAGPGGRGAAVVIRLEGAGLA